MMYRWHDGWGWGGWVFLALMMLMFWAGVAALVVALWRNARTSQGIGTGGMLNAPLGADDEAMRVLRRRFAKGEIDADEFSERRDVLQRQ